MQRLILKNSLSPGDILMLTAAVRDLHRCYPGRFETDVRTSAQALWENNPYVTPIESDASNLREITCHYPSIQESNRNGKHFIHGFTEFLNEALELQIRPTEFGGDIHLSDVEKSQCGSISSLLGADVPYWIIVAGGKYDFTIKWWDTSRFQEVVNALQDRVLFVQVGSLHHYHPPLSGVVDLRGKTSLRELIRLVYHSDGVLCPVTFLMHLAAAVEAPPGHPSKRPCVVVAGGREPPHWEAYPWHQFVHTVGALGCCQHNGCWKSRTVPLGDGDAKDEPERLCVDVERGLPRCMDMITPDEVVRRVEFYYAGGLLTHLRPEQAALARPFLSRSLREQMRLNANLRSTV